MPNGLHNPLLVCLARQTIQIRQFLLLTDKHGMASMQPLQVMDFDHTRQETQRMSFFITEDMTCFLFHSIGYFSDSVCFHEYLLLLLSS